MATKGNFVDDLERYYNTESRERIDRILARIDTLRTLESLDLLADDVHERVHALRRVASKPMRLYGHIEDDRDRQLVMDAQCAETHDFRVSNGQTPMDVMNMREFLAVRVPLDAMPDIREGDFVEISLVRAHDTDNRSRVAIRRTPVNGHPAVDGTVEYMALNDWRLIERGENDHADD